MQPRRFFFDDAMASTLCVQDTAIKASGLVRQGIVQKIDRTHVGTDVAVGPSELVAAAQRSGLADRARKHGTRVPAPIVRPRVGQDLRQQGENVRRCLYGVKNIGKKRGRIEVSFKQRRPQA